MKMSDMQWNLPGLAQRWRLCIGPLAPTLESLCMEVIAPGAQEAVEGYVPISQIQVAALYFLGILRDLRVMMCI